MLEAIAEEQVQAADKLSREWRDKNKNKKVMIPDPDFLVKFADPRAQFSYMPHTRPVSTSYTTQNV